MRDFSVSDQASLAQIADLLLEAHAIAKTTSYPILKKIIEMALLENARQLVEEGTSEAPQPPVEKMQS